MTRRWSSRAGTDGLAERIAGPGRREIENEIWDWVVRGEDDADEFVGLSEEDEQRHGATDEDLRAAYEKALAARQPRATTSGTTPGTGTGTSGTTNRTRKRCSRARTVRSTSATASIRQRTPTRLPMQPCRGRTANPLPGDLDRILDEIVFPVLRENGMRVEWNRQQSRRIRVTGAQRYAPLT
ncbi:hypothetical protein AB0H57_09025 [Micromonospora sp. NPDC050686]|uniref:hypothetical protein n=1 Tax=Micromonospora sp. NPDC050686 TaxID=3154631 RepID=UPI0033F5E059